MPAELDILASFFPLANKVYTTKDIEKKSGYSHERVHTILSKLEKEGKLKRRSFGRTNVYKLQISSELFLAYVYFNEERRRSAKLSAMTEKGCTIFLEDKKKSIIVSSGQELKKHVSDEFVENSIVLSGLELFFNCVYLNRKYQDELSI